MPNARMLKNSPKKRTCCGVVEEARERRVNRKNGQPWVVIKLMVVFTVGIMAYAAYVYIARLCVKMIHRRNGAGGSRGAGIALLSVFLVLYLWMLWAYAKVVLTPPGYAKDHVPKQPRPSFPEQIRPASWNTLDHRVEYGSPDQQHRARPSFSTVQPDLQRIDSIAGPSYESIPMRPNASAVGRTDQTPRQVNDLDTPNDIEVGVLDTFPSSTSRQGRGEKSNSALSEDRWKKKKDSKRTRALEKERPRVHVDRRPPTVPILLPEHRYCGLDEIVKPYRTHHCRTCGTCVLKYDHHCPWIGQCVGARNHKFFVNFVQAALMFTSYTFATLLTYIIRKASARGGSVDPQEIVILVLAAIFILFTGLLLVTHIQLIWVGQTTVESMQARALHGQESMALADVLGRCQILEKRRIRRRWDEEWGTIEKEGNIWWLGSGMKGWVDVMGINRWGWICFRPCFFCHIWYDVYGAPRCTCLFLPYWTKPKRRAGIPCESTFRCSGSLAEASRLARRTAINDAKLPKPTQAMLFYITMADFMSMCNDFLDFIAWGSPTAWEYDSDGGRN